MPLIKKKPKRGYVLPPSPPKITSAIQFTHTFRWQNFALNGVADEIILTSYLLEILVMAATSSTVYSLLDAVRIKRVSMWAPALAQTGIDSAGAPTIVSNSLLTLEFTNSINGSVGTKPNRVTDVSMGAMRNACVTLKPPKDSSAGQWQSTTATSTQSAGSAIVVTAPMGAVIDITASFFLQEHTTPNPGPVPAGASAVTGTVYQAPLDGVNGNWLAVGYPTYNV